MSSPFPRLEPLQLFEEVPCYVSVQSPELKIIQANRRFREDFGDCTGQYCYQAYKHRDEPCDECQVVKTFRDGLVHSSEERVKSKSGESICMAVHTSPLKDASGKIVAVIEMSTNITEVRQLQGKLASLGQLVASTAHSIKGIITGLEGGVYVVNSGFKNKRDEKVKKGWEMVQRNIERISSLALDMLYYSKDRVPEKSQFSMAQLLDDVCILFQEKMKRKSIEFRAQTDAAPCEYVGDKKAIHSALTNVLENAIDACVMDSDNDKKHHVELTAGSDRGDTVIEVADNGSGMDKETRERIFDLFYSTKESSGTGLGLMVAYKAVKEHGGDIQVESTAGQGTRFIVRLPNEKL